METETVLNITWSALTYLKCTTLEKRNTNETPFATLCMTTIHVSMVF